MMANVLDRRTLVLDLDETLIHCNTNSSSKTDLSLPVKFPTGELIQAPINIRPYA
jgi:CTD small phosphatase-like protein 2